MDKQSPQVPEEVSAWKRIRKFFVDCLSFETIVEEGYAENGDRITIYRTWDGGVYIYNEEKREWETLNPPPFTNRYF